MNDSSLPQGTRPTLALSVTGLTKHYDSGFTLDDATFDLPSGYIMGLVGPNGAGKSTLIKLILNMTTRDAGRIEVLGLDAMADEERVKEQLGVVLDSSYFIEYMTVDAVERTSRPMYPLWDHNLFDTYLRQFGLGRNKKIKDLSRGMQMKLMLAVALSHDAKLLILDEPTSGLDVLSRDELMDILSDYVADGEHSVIFSTHITADWSVARISSRISRTACCITAGRKTSSKTRSVWSRAGRMSLRMVYSGQWSASAHTQLASTRWSARRTSHTSAAPTVS